MLDQIQSFLACRRVAVIGVSHQQREFSRMVYRALRERGYDVVPVNPKAGSVEGAQCFARVQEATPPVEAALVMTPPAASEDVVRDCFAADVKRIWLYRHAPAAEAWCAERGLVVISGECPMMFLERAGWIHRVHRWFWNMATGGQGPRAGGRGMVAR